MNDMQSARFRTDIQALRGFAIVLVVLYHAKLGVAAGYLGVDIFFVISGYVITGMIKQGIEDGNFRFSAFYFRRAKRLLPAAFVTFVVASLLSMIFLDASEQGNFATQLLGAATFTGNIVLWRQAGYFDGAAALKPLLHVWSLSIEEQYYLLLPAAFVFIPRRFWLMSAGFILVSSLGLCLVLMAAKPVAAFYLLPTRAWELTVGSVAALQTLNSGERSKAALEYLFWPSVAALLILPMVSMGTSYPGIDALVACISTMIVILRRHDALNATGGSRALARVGDFSYSLYLVHWPIFAFVNNLFIGEPPKVVYLCTALLSVCTGFLLHRYVELPIRHADLAISPKLGLATFAAFAAIVSGTFGMVSLLRPSVDYTQIRRVNTGFGTSCEFAKAFTPRPECRNSDNPSILVWGDSYAMHLVPGMVATTGAGVIQATKSMCGPFMGIAPFDGTYTRYWAERCLAFNQSVFDYLTVTPSIDVVVLSSPFIHYLSSGDSHRPTSSLVLVGNELVEREPNVTGAVDAMRKTVDKLRGIGKRVVIVAPPPTSGLDIGRCLERKATGHVILGTHGDCDIPIGDYRKNVLVSDFLRQVQVAPIPVISFDEILCSDSSCASSINGTFIYRDSGHFSYDGSRLVAKLLGLGELVQSVAR